MIYLYLSVLNCYVSLPSASQTEPKTILEQQNIIKSSQAKEQGGAKVVDQVTVNDSDSDVESDQSESDNEEIDEVVPSKEKNLNFDDEFEKIVPYKFKKLSEESIDEADQEIAEILSENLNPDGQQKSENIIDEVKNTIEVIEQKIEDVICDVTEKIVEPSPEPELDLTEQSVVDFRPIESDITELSSTENTELDQIQSDHQFKVIPKELTPASETETDGLESKITEPELKETIINGVKSKETIIDEELLPKELILDDQKPPVPIQTYLWEDVKKSREQGGYPWTHIYKQPLGADEEPEIILKYNHSPRSARKADNSETGTPKSQKKVRIQDEIEIQETQNYIQDLSDDDDNENDENDGNLEPTSSQQVSSEVKKSPKSILKRSQKILDNIKPHTSKFDSSSFKSKINNPLKKIKKMADQQFKKVKAKRNAIKKIPVSKDEIVLNEEVKILKLKESPKSQKRDVAAYIVKQDSDDTVEIIDLEESPTENRKRRDQELHETGLVTPDEIIELPVNEESKIEVTLEGSPQPEYLSEGSPNPESFSEEPSTTEEMQEPSVEEIIKEEIKSEVASAQKKREHIYEDIEDYISKITSDSENVNRSHCQESKLQRQKELSASDPIFDDFSMEMNRQIRKSLTLQDDKIKIELMKRIPKIEGLAKQISDEDKSEKDDKVEDIPSPTIKQTNLLAPISSIDSTSSDEDRKAQLSILAEESETSDSNKKKSFDESSVDNIDIESLNNDDGSDISTTLIDDELKGFEEKPEDINISEKMESTESKIEVPEKEASSNYKIAKESSPELPETDPDLKEDVIINQNLENASAIKVSERWSKMSDHEYEPIGDPMKSGEHFIDQTDHEALEAQKRKNSETNDGGVEKKFMRTPTVDSEDNISAQDFQDQLENRFFSHGIEPIAADKEDIVHQENTFEEAVIIDEEPVQRDVPRKRNFMSNAQEQGRSFHKKIKAQAGMFKTSLNNKMKKKPKETPVSVEVAQETELPVETTEDTVEEPAAETVTVNVQSAEVEQKSKSSLKMPKFTKNIKKPTMPKFKRPQFKKPDMPKISLPDRPKMPDLKMSERFSSLRKLGRSKSLKEPSDTTNDSTSFTTPEAATAEPTKKKFDFGTYPRLIKDKFKRSKLPERSDRSVRSDTPPVLEFTQVSEPTTTQRGPVASRWPEYDQDSGKYQQFNSESDIDRETSVERRMREDFDRNTEEREDFEIVRRLISEDQRQLEEMDKENQEIHLMAQQDRFRKPFVERQESDVVSDDDKLLWSGILNKDSKEDYDPPNALQFDDGYKFTLDDFKNADINRSCTPQTNQETQSSGSSGTRRRKGVFDDDDDYFVRENRVSNDVQAGNYVSSAIKEGLSVPDDNALAQMGGYEQESNEFMPEKPTRSLKRRKNKKSDSEEPVEHEVMQQKYDDNRGTFNDYYRTFPPDRPSRKQKQPSATYDEDIDDIDIVGEEVDLNNDHDDPCDVSDIIDNMNENNMFYHQQILKGLEHPEMVLMKDDFDNDFDYNGSKLPVPPTPPRRRKKKVRQFEPIASLRHRNMVDPPAKVDDIIAYRSEEKKVPLAQHEFYLPPIPMPRRTRSRSQISAHTLDDADSFKNDSIEAFNNNQDKENGYAVVRKETPSRPVRRKRSTKSLGDRLFATMPHMRREDDDDIPPPRPARNYSTIIPSTLIPSKPPRRKSASSLVEISKTVIDDDDYEEILDNGKDEVVAKRLQSGDIINKMKDRPLPPPPRPKRESKKQKKDEPSDDKFDKDDGAEKVIEPLKVEIEEEKIVSQSEIIEDIETNVGHEVSVLPRQDSDFSEPERVVEVEVSTQTDPVLDEDFECDDEDIDIEEFLSADGKLKTLEDILKEEQEAEMERARQLAEAENLSRGIQRFKDSNQRSLSERSRTSADRSRSLSRPITPSAVLVERKKSSPIIFDNEPQTMTQAGLFIHPITYDDYGRQPSDEEDQPLSEPLSEPLIDNIDVNNNFETTTEDVVEQIIAVQPEIVESLNIIDDEVRLTISDLSETNQQEEEDIDEIDSEMQRKIEEMIESVMTSAQEEVEYLKSSIENIGEYLKSSVDNITEPEIQEEVIIEPEVQEEINIQLETRKEKYVEPEIENEPPKPPPRKKSYIDDAEIAKKLEEQRIEEALKEIEIDEIEPDVSNTNISEEDQIDFDQELETAEKDDDIKSESLLMPSRLHLSSLEIDNLSVCSLQAGRITASEIDSNTIVTNELECKISNNISNVQTISIPPGLIDEIVERVRCAERESQQKIQAEQTLAENVPEEKVSAARKLETNAEPVQEQIPERPPLPTQFSEYPSTSTVPPSFYQLRNYSDDDTMQAQPPHRRRRHIKRKDSTSEEEYQKEQKSKQRSAGSTDQSVIASGTQFLRACGNALSESGNTLMEILRASSKDENKRDLHIALIILIVIVAGLILLGMGDKSVHHHHWDFFNPPENPGRNY